MRRKPLNTVSDDSESVLFAKIETATGEKLDLRIQIYNSVCNFTIPMHLNLRRVAMSTCNVEYDNMRNTLSLMKRDSSGKPGDPYKHIKVYKSGKVAIQGARGEQDCLKTARRVSRLLQRCMGQLKFKIRLRNYRVSNMMANCQLPYSVRIEEIPKKYKEASCELEITSGLFWKCENPKATLRIHSSGVVTILGAKSSENLVKVIEKMYPLIEEFMFIPGIKRLRPPSPQPSESESPDDVQDDDSTISYVFDDDPAVNCVFDDDPAVDCIFDDDEDLETFFATYCC